MSVRLLFILLIVAVVLAMVPRFRRVGLVLCAVLIACLLWFNVREADSPEPENQPVSVTPAASVNKPRAQLGEMRLEGRGAPWRLHGSVQNLSATPIRSVRLNIERYDCPTPDVPLTGCAVMWQGVRELRVPMGALATANIDETFYSHVAVPSQTGMSRDQITITAVD